MVGRVQMERSENSRGITKHTYSQWKPIPIRDGDKPNLQVIVSCPGWREMSPATAKVTLTLFGLTDAEGKVVISRGELKHRTGIISSRSIAKANSELETIGLFQIDRGYKTKYAERPTTYRLSWYSQAFQKWLKNGNSPDVPEDHPAPPKALGRAETDTVEAATTLPLSAIPTTPTMVLV